MKRAAEDRYLGELYIDRSEWTTNKCCFELGTAPLKDKYIQQFIEIFTEEGRKQVSVLLHVSVFYVSYIYIHSA